MSVECGLGWLCDGGRIIGPGGHPVLGEEGEKTAGVLFVAAHGGLGVVRGAQVATPVREQLGEVASVHCGGSAWRRCVIGAGPISSAMSVVLRLARHLCS